MTRLVVDVSAAASWLLPSQMTEAARALFRRWSELEPIAPAFFEVEIRSILLKAERRGWLRGLSSATLYSQLEIMGIQVQPHLDRDELNDVFELAKKTGVGFYDGLYLDLALKTGASMASRDGNLLNGAERAGVAIIDLRPPQGVHEEAAIFARA